MMLLMMLPMMVLMMVVMVMMVVMMMMMMMMIVVLMVMECFCVIWVEHFYGIHLAGTVYQGRTCNDFRASVHCLHYMHQLTKYMYLSKHIVSLSDRQRALQTYSTAYRPTDRHTDRHEDIKTDRQSDKKANRQL